MNSMLTSRAGDDPHDIVAVPPDAVRVAPADDEISSLLQQAARQRVDAETRVEPSFVAAATVPPLDTTFRAASVDGVLPPEQRRSPARRALRGLIALLLAAAIGGAAFVWKAYGDVAVRQVARLTTQFMLSAWQPAEKPVQSAQADEPVAAATDPSAQPASPQPAGPAQNAAEAAAPAAAASADPAQSLQSMASDLAGVRQEVEQLKASLAELKASLAREAGKTADVKATDTKASEVRTAAPAPRPKIAAAAPRPAAARVHKPLSSYPQTQAAAPPYVPPAAAAPYLPRQADPQTPTTGEALTDPELASVPRPPMPLR